MAQNMSSILDKIEKNRESCKTANAFTLEFQDFAFDGTATPPQMRSFLEQCMKYCDGKHGKVDRKLAKRKALDNLMDIVDHGPSRHFQKLNGNIVTFQLALRVLEPRRLNQRDFGLCGPSHFLILHCKSHPDKYVTMAVDLWIKGVAVLEDASIEPNQFVRGYDPGLTIAHADWLMAASLRNSDQNPSTLSEKDKGAYENTKPHQVFQWMKSAGYRQVVQLSAFENTKWDDWLASKVLPDSYLQFHPGKPEWLQSHGDLHKPLNNIKLAASLLEKDWRVLLVIYADWAAYAKPGKEAKASLTDKAEVLAQADPIYTALGPGMKEADRQQMFNENVKKLARQKPMRSEEQIVESINDAWKSRILGLIQIPAANHWIMAKSIDIVDDNTISVTRYTWGTKERTEPFPLIPFLLGYSGFVAAHD